MVLETDSTAQVRGYTVQVSQQKIERLKQKLELTDLPDELENVDWKYGTPLADVRRLANYWKTQYQWEKTEKYINSLPNYITTVTVDEFDPVEVHFLHQKSSVENAIPLLFVHGWPGSFLEVTRLLPLLGDANKDGPAFHIIAPSLPNFGFSGAVRKPGFGLKQYAETCHKLMTILGYDQYVTQGGDWGSTITRVMGELYPTHVRASHLNLVPSPPPPVTSPIAFVTFLVKHMLKMYTPAESAGLERTQEIQKSGFGYYHMQTTRPQTLGYALADSPVGLLAWMYEKLHDWTDEYTWSEEEACMWASIYYFSNAGPAASVRIYYESMRGSHPAGPGKFNPAVKLGLAYFPKEMVLLPKAWASSLGPIVYVKEHQKGGHFAAWEQPEAIAGDLRTMFGKNGGAYGVVEGKSGYT